MAGLVPAQEGARWAWNTLLISGLIGFGSFLSYLGYGYLDSWHTAATMALLPAFLGGLWRSRRSAQTPVRSWLLTEVRLAPPLVKFGRYGLLATGAGLLLAGLVISYIGVTDVFVREDLAFIGVTRESLDSVNARLVPLIAHDRSGFGGGLTTVGALFLMCGWYARPSRSFHQAALVAGGAGFACGIGTHFAEGYLNPLHLAPAMTGAALFACSITAEMVGYRRWIRTRPQNP